MDPFLIYNMELVELSSTDKESYNQFVAAQPSGSFLQSWEWGQWQESLGRQVERLMISRGAGSRFAGKDERGETAGVIQLIKMPLSMKKFYLYAPYGPVLAGGEQGSEKLKVESLKWENELRQKFSDAVFIRIEPKSAEIINHKSKIIKSSNIQPAKTLLIDLNKTEAELLGKMHHKTRYNIKVAQKHGVVIQDEFAISVGHGLFYEEALKLITNTAKRHQFITYNQNYYKGLVDFFALQKSDVKLHIYKAIHQGNLLASAIMIDFGTTRTFLFGGSLDKDKNVMAPYLLHWQAIKDAQLHGLKIYDFWGIETAAGDTPGFVRFKLGFGGQEVSYAGAYDLVQNRKWYAVYKIGRKTNKIFGKLKKKFV